MKAIRLHRVSSPKQAEDDRHSIPAQQKRTESYLLNTDYLEEYKVYDIAESAYRGKRKKFKPLIDDVRNSNECVAIVVDCVDRFQRDFREAIIFDDLRKDGKCEIHFIQDGLVITKNSTNREVIKWYELILDAKKYSAKISDNVQRGFEDKKNKGQRLGLPPLGYKLEEGKQIFTPDFERWDLVVRIFTEYEKNLYSDRQVGKIVSDLGLRTRPTKKFLVGCEISKHIVRKVLKSKFYCGYVENSEGEEIKGQHQPMISESLFEKCQRIRNHSEKQNVRKRMRTDQKIDRNFFPFRGLMVCGYCGSTMTFQNQYKKNGKVHTYCTCAGKHNGNKNCQQKYYPVREIDEIFLNIVGSVSYDARNISVAELIAENKDSDFAEAKSKIRKLNSKITSLEQQKDNLMKKLAMDVISDQDYKRFAEIVKEEERQIRIQIKELEIKNPNCQEDINNFLSFLCDLKGRYQEMSPRDKHNLVTVLGSKLVLNGSKTEFIYNQPFDTVFKSCPDYNSCTCNSLLFQGTSYAKVHDPYISLFIYHDVAGLQIAVHDS